MRPASTQSFADTDRPPLRRRATALLLVLGVEALMVAMLLRLAPAIVGPPRPKPAPALFQLLPEPRIAPTHSRTPAKVRHGGGGGARPSPAPPVASASHAASHAQANPPLNIVHLGHDAFAAADIGALPSRAAPDAGATASASGTGGGGEGGAGAGPDGAQLYSADWYIRPPSQAELSPYLPAHVEPSSWGRIVCRMVADHRVQDCRQYGESPAGSGLARGMREAAWQFRVLPPRIDGRPILGVWVLITLYF